MPPIALLPVVSGCPHDRIAVCNRTRAITPCAQVIKPCAALLKARVKALKKPKGHGASDAGPAGGAPAAAADDGTEGGRWSLFDRLTEILLEGRCEEGKAGVRLFFCSLAQHQGSRLT